jgi:hypothetical protein
VRRNGYSGGLRRRAAGTATSSSVVWSATARLM